MSQFVQQLFVLNSGRARASGASLPHAVLDPNPGLTVAAFNLWAALRPFLAFRAPNGTPGLAISPNGRPFSVAEAFAGFRTALVRFLAKSYCSVSKNLLFYFRMHTRRFVFWEDLRVRLVTESVFGFCS